MSNVDGFIAIDYDEFDQGSYRAVKISTAIGQPFEAFSTGDPCADFAAAMEWGFAQGCKQIVYSSSVDDFLNDGDQYQYDEKNRIIPADKPIPT